MRKHAELDAVTYTPKTRIGIVWVSSGTAWRLFVGLHPFGKKGGTTGNIKTFKNSVDAVDVAGSAVGDITLLQYAVDALARIMGTGDGDAVVYALEVRAALQEAMGMDKIERKMRVARLFTTLGMMQMKGEFMLPAGWETADL